MNGAFLRTDAIHVPGGLQPTSPVVHAADGKIGNSTEEMYDRKASNL